LPPDDPEGLMGEDVRVPVCLLVAPHAGVFHHVTGPADTSPRPTDEPNIVDQGHVIGDVVNLQRTTTVSSPASGLLMGLLAAPGERVRPGQPLAWLRFP
jgi:biotin carboxyl carrier protein